MEIALLHSRRWANTLVLTASAALIAGCASPALAQAGDARPASTPTVEAKPLSSAGWRGQPIRRPYEARGVADAKTLGILRFRDGLAAEVQRHKAVIERICSQRGWTLASLVRDSHPAKAGGRKRSGLAYALEQLANGDASRLVTRSLDHLARSPRRLGAPLEWCAGHGVDLVAVDVGLDTSTHDGRLVAGRLLAAARNGEAHDARRTAPRRRRADTRNGSRHNRDEPIAAPWRRKAPVALIGWTR